MELVISPTKNLPSEVLRAYDTLGQHFLSGIWDKMGLDGESLKSRRLATQRILTENLLGMKAEEEETLNKLINRVEAFAKERARLEKELGIVLDPLDSDLSLVQLEKQLRRDVRALEDKKEEQMQEVRRYRKEDEMLCAILEMDPYYVSTKVIPTKAQLDALKKHVIEMQDLKDKRSAQFSEAKLEIISCLDQLEQEPGTSFERMVVCDDEENFTLSYANLEKAKLYLQELEEQIEKNRVNAEEMRRRIFSLMEKLEVDTEEKRKIKNNMGGHSPMEIKELQLRLDELEILKGEKMEQFINATRNELVYYWDLCYYGRAQRDKFSPFRSNVYNDETLHEHEREVERLKEYYVANVTLFNKVEKRQELWRKMLELDAKQKDPQHLLKAKGKDLLIEERDRKRVNSQLPKVNEDLRECMAEYYEKNGTPFLVGGIPYEDFLEEQEEEFRRQQEYERQSKQKMKKETNFHETIYGSKPMTPAKRAAAGGGGGGTLKRRRDPSPGGPAGKHSRLARAESTFGSATLMRSPFRGSSAANRTRSATASRTGAMNKSRVGLRPNASRRKILGENGASVLMAGNAMRMGGGPATGNKPKPFHNDTMSTVDSENFLREMPNMALTSTMQRTPEASLNLVFGSSTMQTTSSSSTFQFNGINNLSSNTVTFNNDNTLTNTVTNSHTPKKCTTSKIPKTILR